MSQIIAQEEGSAPSTPGTGRWKLYPKAGGWYVLDDAGNEIGPLFGDAPSDGSQYARKDAAWEAVAASGGGSNSICDGRLTLANATPVTTTDQTAKTTVYFTPYKGNKISLYDGSADWDVIAFAEASVSVPATTSTPFDVFAYNNSGTIALETVNWTSDAARATALTLQDGALVKTGATTRRYLGTGRTTAVSGQCEDSISKRFLWNYYNRVPRKLKVIESTANWTYGTTTWRSYNNSAANRVEVIVGYNEELVTLTPMTVINPNGSQGNVGVGLDKTNGNDADIGIHTAGPNTITVLATALYKNWVGVGYHYLQMVEYGGGGGTPVNFYGAVGVSQSGMVGELNG